MIRSIIFLCAFIACAGAVNAQNFMSHLTSRADGQGAVSVLQDARLDAIVNGDKKYIAPAKENGDKLPGVQTGKKVKARGYRIQVFWGGASNADRSNAERAGANVTALFPELQAYTTFKSPNWSCRVGDFANRDEAYDYLKKMRSAGVVKNADVVRSEVFVYQQE